MENVKSTSHASTPVNSKHFDSFDLFKCIAAFFVVSLHVPFSGTIGAVINAIARIAVPFFFLVSGFFSYQKDFHAANIRKKRIRKIKRFLFLLLGITVVYFLCEVLMSCFNHTFPGNLQMYLKFPFLIGHLNATGSHMWFVRAMIYLELLFLFCEPLFRKKWTVFLVLGAWLFDVLALKYSGILFGFEIPQPYAELLTKYMGTAFVFYTAGYLFRRHETDVVNFFEKLGTGKSISILLILLMANIAEFGLLKYFGVNRMPVNYFFTFFLTLTVFSLLLIYRNFGSGSIFAYIGRELSMYIYYWHLAIYWIGGILLSKIPFINTLYRNPLFLYMECIIFSLLIIQVKTLLQKKQNTK